MSVPELPRPLAGRRRRVFAGLIGVGFAGAAAAVAWASAIGSAVGALTGAPSPTGPAVTAAVLVGLALVSAALLGVERVLAERLGQSWVNDLRVAVYERVARTPVRGPHRSTGAAAMRFAGDMTAVRRWACLGLAKLAVAVPLITGCLLALALASPVVAGAVAAVLLVGTVAVRVTTPRLRAADRRARNRRARVSGQVTERIAQRLVVQAFGREDAERRELRRSGRRLERAMVRRARIIGLVRALGEATTLLATATALVVAGPAGLDAAAAASVLAVIGVLAAPLRDLARVAEYRTASDVALDKLVQTVRRPVRARPVDAARLPDGGGQLVLTGVGVGGIVTGATATVAPGGVVLLRGPNGSGKTTLLTVLAGLLRPDSGSVALDGVDLHTLDEADLRRAIGMAGPDLPLLRGTVADNIRYGDPAADGWALREAVHVSGLDEVLPELPHGLETRLGEGGAGLSAGQRQRVAIARAVLARPRVLLLDEADAHLDPAAAGVVDRLLERFSGTVVLVSHRRTARPGAASWWLEGGRLETSR